MRPTGVRSVAFQQYKKKQKFPSLCPCFELHSPGLCREHDVKRRELLPHRVRVGPFCTALSSSFPTP